MRLRDIGRPLPPGTHVSVTSRDAAWGKIVGWRHNGYYEVEIVPEGERLLAREEELKEGWGRR